MRNFFVLISLIFVVAWNTKARAQASNGSTGAINQQILTEQSVTPAEPSRLKLTVSSTYYDLEGTKYADANSYGFGDVRVYQQIFAAEYALPQGWKAIFKAQYVKNDYDVLAGKLNVAEDSSGLGDTFLGAGHSLFKSGDFSVRAEGGFFVPTGSIGVDNPYSASHLRYKYFMQLGSGTYDPTLILYSTYEQKHFQWVTKFLDVEHLGRNTNDYALGHVYRGDTWLYVPVGLGFTGEALAYYRLRGAVQGNDPDLQIAATEFYHRDQIDWMSGVGVKYSHPIFQDVAINAEVVLPIQQGMTNYDHVVISTNYYGNLSLSGKF